jgi:formate hydrogenlyase subunit 3/multisubunit Na+/H+ antiporter MnhD subunit
MAYLPASLDKLLGIYLLTRICVDIFRIVPNSPMSILLLAIGSFTIIAAVLGALVQHNLKKLLSFHAVSQVGYMVLGIGTGLPIGIAGGLFHMFNNAIYKCCLFLVGGAVEKRTGTTELNQLGGLARFMPLTFMAALVASLSISGVPPFNGFASKWMIYQGVIELGKTSNLWIIWLIAAVFGSALTLASFMKLMHATFLGQWSEWTQKAKEVSWFMWLPMIALALLCVIFGVFAYAVPIRFFIQAAVPGISYTGIWSPALATILIVVGLLIGLIIYWLGKVKIATAKPAYVGGELLDEKMTKVSGVDFYDTIKKWGFLPWIYKWAEAKLFDIYEWGKAICRVLTAGLRWLHNGLLHTYLAWILLGTLILLYILMRQT